jgi:hypothetical protein
VQRGFLAFVLALLGAPLACGPASPASRAPAGARVPRDTEAPSTISPLAPVGPPEAAPTPTEGATLDVDLRAAFGAHAAGRLREARDLFDALVTRQKLPLRSLTADDDISVAEVDESGRHALVHSGRCRFESNGTTTFRSCGEILVDVQAPRIIGFAAANPEEAMRKPAHFLGPWLVAWGRGGQRVLSLPDTGAEVDATGGEPLVALPGAARVLTADARGISIRDVRAHRDEVTFALPDIVISNPEGLLLRVVGQLAVAEVHTQVAAFDLASGRRRFVFATDHDRSRTATVGTSPNGKELVVLEACDWTARSVVKPSVFAPCTPKADCVRPPLCPSRRDASVDLATGKITWQAHDPARPSSPLATPPEGPEPPAAALAPLFCRAGDDLLLPADICARR